MATYLGDYEKLLAVCIEQGYRFVGFTDDHAVNGELILRHDIDFDCGLAHDMARLEAARGISATYFFMLRSDSYNLLSAGNVAHVRAIEALGHRISLHFDPTIYEDFAAGFATEKAIFEATFTTQLKIISIHRPNDFFLDYDEPIGGIAHSYQRRFAKDITYISDSQGRFRYGHPLKSAAFAQGRTIHLLIHPIWWMVPNPCSPVGLLDDFLNRRVSAYQDHMASNCLPYAEHLKVRR